MKAQPRALAFRALAIGCSLLALTLSSAIVVLVIKGCPGEVARWTGRPEGRVVVQPGMTREQVRRQATIAIGEYGDSGRFVDFELTTERILFPGIQMFRLDSGEDGRISFVSMLTANESWPDLVRAATSTEVVLLANGWKPDPGQPSIPSLTSDPRKAAAEVTESGEIANTRFVYRKGTQEFQIAAGGLWSGISWWQRARHAKSFWRNMNYFPLGNPHSVQAAHSVPPVLLFAGTGTSPNDVTAVKTILEKQHLEYSSVTSSQLNGMSDSQLRAYRLMIAPGGNYITIGDNLTPTTAANIHNAVQGGLNYLGICAGGFLAGNLPNNGLNLTEGVRFDFYAAVNTGVHKAAVEITGVGTPAIEHYWEDGPQYTGWGAVVGRYPDGTPAIVEGRSGKGWVLLVGTHPEAPETWRRGMTFTTPTGTANAYAGTLIEAALNGTSLPHY